MLTVTPISISYINKYFQSGTTKILLASISLSQTLYHYIPARHNLQQSENMTGSVPVALTANLNRKSHLVTLYNELHNTEPNCIKHTDLPFIAYL